MLARDYHIYPMDMGGILLEFVYSGWDYSVEVTPTGRIEIYGVQVEGPGDLDVMEFRGVDDKVLIFLDGLTGSAR